MGFLPAHSFNVIMEKKCKGGAEKLRERKKTGSSGRRCQMCQIDTFSAVAGPSPAPVADESGGGVGSSGINSVSEEETQEERDRDEGVRVEPAVSLDKNEPKTSGGQTVDDNTTTIKEVGRLYTV